MARQKNDGRGRLGGRSKGTPNKSTTDLRNWLSGVLNGSRNQFERDLKELLPEERVRVLSGLFNYVIPKQQSLSVEEQISNETEALSRWLESAPQEAIDGIAKRVIELQKMNKAKLESESESDE
jgi:hypothetical protein